MKPILERIIYWFRMTIACFFILAIVIIFFSGEFTFDFANIFVVVLMVFICYLIIPKTIIKDFKKYIDKNKNIENNSVEEIEDINYIKQCPYCAEEVKEKAKICKHCGKTISKKWEIKTCKYCKSEIDKKAKNCPNCGKSQQITIGCGGTIIVLFIIFMIIFFLFQGDNPYYTTSTTSVEQQCNDYYNAPKVCAKISSWDGSYGPLVNNVKNSMKNPKSFEHIETLISDKGGSVVILMKYSGTNSFNAVVSEYIKISVDKETLEMTKVQ